MEYKVDGIIEFSPAKKLNLDKPTKVNSPSESVITLTSTEDNNLRVEIILETDTATDAKELAEIELKRICDLLSYFYNIPIMESRTISVSAIIVTPAGKQASTLETSVGLRTIVSHVQGLGPEATKKLIHDLEKDYPPNFEDVISMWREAISTETPALKYLMLYRLMEFLFKSDTRELTNWIKASQPSVQLFSDRQRSETTIYTYLRDNIHPKQKHFPIGDIAALLPRLETLVKQAIDEKVSNK
jgi:hypothetical protein